jgi:hypothetical protein
LLLESDGCLRTGECRILLVSNIIFVVSIISLYFSTALSSLVFLFSLTLKEITATPAQISTAGFNDSRFA